MIVMLWYSNAEVYEYGMVIPGALKYVVQFSSVRGLQNETL